MPQYIQQFPIYATSTSHTIPLDGTSYTIQLDQARNITTPVFPEINEPLPNEIIELQDAVDYLRRRIDDITKVALQTESVMRSLKEHLEEYEAATIPVEEVIRFFWKYDDGE